MRNISKWILSAAGATLLGAAAVLYTKENSLEPRGEFSTIPQEVQQETVTEKTQQHGKNGTTRVIVGEEPRTQEDLRKEYDRFVLSGQVRQDQRPLSNVNIEANVASIVRNTQNVWRTKTDHNGRFSVRVPALTSYDIEARFTTEYGSEKRREVTHAPSENIDIIFDDSPDVKLSLRGDDTIKRAVLQTFTKKTLEGLIRGNEAIFEDVPEGTLYNVFIATASRAVIQDQIPVFDADVHRDYTAPQKIVGQIQARDARNKSGIAEAEIMLTLPNIDQEIFAEKVVTDQNGNWQGWLTPTRYHAEASAEEYSRKKIDDAGLDSEGRLTILLERGTALKGRVIDQEGRCVAGVGVHLLDPLGLSPFEGLKSGVTDNEGIFEIKSINPNRSEIWEPGQQAYIPVAVKKGYIQPALEAIVFENGGKNTPQEITLQIVKTKERINGKVMDSSNNPVQSWLEIALISLPGSGNVSNTPFWQRYNLETNPDGSFLLPDIAPGKYAITAFPGKDAEKDMKTRQEISVPASSPVQIVLEEGMPLEGRVVQYNGKKAEGVNFRFTKRNDPWEAYARTDSQGNFVIVAPRGQIDYFAWWKDEKRGGVLEEQRGCLDTSAVQQSIMLRDHQYIEMKVTDSANRQPIPVYSATFIESEGPRRITVRNGFDQQGTMYFPLSDPFFPLRVVVQAQGYAPERREITKGINQKVDVEVKKKKE